MTDRTKVDTSSNMTICCKNCLNDTDYPDVGSSCFNCEAHNGKYYYFLGLKEDKSQKDGYVVVKTPNSVYKDGEITVDELLNRIQAEKEMKSQLPMFGGAPITSVYD